MLYILIIYGIWIFADFLSLTLTGRSLSPKRQITNYYRESVYMSNEKVIERILEMNFSYFKMLSGDLKTEFRERVMNFMVSKDFRPCAMKTVSLEQKVMISASAVQLTFGLDDYLLQQFNDILVYPESYYSRLKREYHKGEVNLGGLIVISYDNFLLGYNDEKDGVNLGLHEMAHALKFNQLLDEESDNYFKAHYQQWLSDAENELSRLQHGGTSILREYSQTNINEFLAVCAENFFERPEQFKEELPELYDKMVMLLNQDPARRENPILQDPGVSDNAMSEMAMVSDIEYESPFQWNKAVASLLPCLIIFIPVVIIYSWPIRIIAIIILMLNILLILSVAKKILICKDHTIIRPVLSFGKRNDIYSHENIAFIDICTIPRDEISVKYYLGKIIKAKNYKIKFDEFDRNALIYKLSLHKIKVNLFDKEPEKLK